MAGSGFFAALASGILILLYANALYAQAPDVVGVCVGGPGPSGQFLTAAEGGCCDPPSEECCKYAATKNTNWCPSSSTGDVKTPKEPTAPSPGIDIVVVPSGMYYNTHDVAMREYKTVWDEGWNTESDPEMAPVVDKYNEAGGCSGNSPTEDPWSAAFISYVMERSGIPFPASCAHIDYFREIKNHPGICKTYPMSEGNMIAPGDILCQCRPETGKTSCKINYSSLPAGFKPAHCDVVISKSADSVEVIGGNLGNSVKKVTRKLNDANLFGFISCAGMGKPLPPEAKPTDVPSPVQPPAPPACPLALLFLLAALLLIAAPHIERKG